MKKLIIFLCLLAFVFIASAQNGTIEDNRNSIKLTYPNGLAVGVMKHQVALVSVGNDGKVYLVTSHRWSNDRLTSLASLDPDEFGWSSAETLRDYIDAMCAKNYDKYIVYTESLADSSLYYIGDSLAFYIPHGHTGSLPTYDGAPRH